MPRTWMVRAGAISAVLALVGSGCGVGPDPVVSTEQEVLDALMVLRDGAQVRAIAELELDRDEVRDVLRDDTEARALLRDALDGGDADDVDALLADLEEAQATLADHAVLLATGADGSARIAAEYRSAVWADLRVGTDPGDGGDPASDVGVDLQLQVDWATAAEVFDQPDLLGDLDEAAAEIAPFLGDMPDLEPVQELLLAFLGGELVGIGGVLTPDLLDGLGLSAQGLSGTADAGSGLGFGALELDPRELAETAFTFDDYRRQDTATLVAVTLEVREVAEVVLDRLAEAPDRLGMTFEDVEAARAELDELPDRLVDVATLRLDESGAVQQLRLDLLDAAVQLARAAEPDDDDLATAARVLGQLDATGLFVALDVENVGQTDTVLGDPATTVSPEELAAAFGALLFGGLGGELDPGALGLEDPTTGGEG